MIRTENHLREIVTIFFVQKNLILSTTVTFVLFAALVGLFWPPQYSAVAEVLVKGKKVEKSPEALEDTQIRNFELNKEDLASEVQILMSPDVLENTIRTMVANDEYYTQEDLDPDIISQKVIQLQKKLDINVVPNSNIIEVAISGTDAEKAKITLDHIITAYVSYRGGIYNPGKVKQFFSDQVDRFKKDLEGNETKLIELVGRTGAPNPNVEIEHNLTRKRDMEQQLSQLENDIVEREGLIDHLDNSLRSKSLNFFSFIENISINQLSEKLQKLIIEEGNLLRIYTKTHPKSVAIREQIQNIYGRLRNEMKEYVENQRNILDSGIERISIINQRLNEISIRNVELHTQLIQQQRIQREIDLLKHSYGTFAKRLEEARIGGSNDVGALFRVSVLSTPMTTGKAVFPNVKMLLPIALLAGFITGLSLGFIKEFFDHTFKTPEDSEKYAGLETIFTIPRWVLDPHATDKKATKT
ncbi:GumC family protein [Maridesulfovibrio frigidus]|uniref:GumC family protein n=1 Tax=Maridesulfovibrio frigidus TaxID=340956 RepID=UPI0004E0EF20|nr:Wzz/FepE/Etk N-terminal domain-containing protein [Maridesulfovibrio frigidus]